MRYNGSTNYVTHMAAKWIDNDPPTRAAVASKAREIVREHGDSLRSVSNLSNWLETTYSRHMHEVFRDENNAFSSGFWPELIKSALDSVNFTEIARDAIEAVLPVEAA